MAVTRGTLQIMRRLRRDIGTEVDAAARTLTADWVATWDDLAPAWERAADELVTAAAQLQRWPRPVEIMRMGRVDTAMRASIAALDKLADRTETVARDGADRIVQLDAEREARIIASQAPKTEEPALTQRVQSIVATEALREAWALRETAQDDVRLAAVSRIRTDAINVITARTGEQIHSATVPLSPAAVDSMRRELVQGIDVGANPRTAAAGMVANVQGQFNGGLTRALNISRTEMLDAYRTTSQQIHLANQDIVPGWSWLAAFDTRVCPSCISMHGSQFPAAEPGPIDHAQGRCARLPVLTSWAELGISAPEPPSALPNAEEWFASLPRAQQLQIMGPGRLQLLDDGLIGWGDLSMVRQTPGWRPSRAPTPVRDLQARASRGLPPTPSPAARLATQPRARPTQPPAPTFDQREAAARTGDDALNSAPVSLIRPQDPLTRIRNKPQYDSLRDYKSTAYSNINQALRREHGAPDWLRSTYPQIDHIDAALARSALPDEVLLYRGIKDGPAVFGPAWQRNLTGAQWTEHAYLSTTASGGTAARFVADGGATFRVLAPRGTRAAQMSDSAYESELLLERGLNLRVVSDTGPGSAPRRIDVEIIR